MRARFGLWVCYFGASIIVAVGAIVWLGITQGRPTLPLETEGEAHDTDGLTPIEKWVGAQVEFRQASIMFADSLTGGLYRLDRQITAVVDLTSRTIELIRDHETRLQEIEYALRWRRFDEMGAVQLPPIILEDGAMIGELGE